MRPLHALIAAAFFAGSLTPTAQAQTPVPASSDAWSAWHGCWRADDDVAGTGLRICVMPDAAGRTRWVTLVGAQRLREETRTADGVARPIVDEACRGTESSRWSAEGHRLYHDATVTCGAEPARRLASVAYLVPGPALVDVQTVIEGGATNVRVQRLRRAANQTLPDGTAVARTPGSGGLPIMSRPWTVADVIEASAHLPADGVQAAIMEGPTAFSLTKSTLVAMADAHVAEPVIDLMVATTYPKHFLVQSAGAVSAVSMGSAMASGWVDPFYAPIIGPASLYNCYSPYGWASSAYWRQCNPYDSGFYSGYPGYYLGYYGDSAYLSGPWYMSTPAGTPSPVTPRGEGRVVNGHGYTQITPVDTSAPGMTGDGRSSGQSIGGSNGGSTSGATTSGYSGGGSSSGGSERTAVPRPPGR